MTKFFAAVLLATVVAVSTGYTLALNGSGSSDPLVGYAKEDCKRGGWEALGFRNQGQCVSYFASNGKAPGYRR